MVSTGVALALTVGTLAVFAGLGIWYSRGRVGTVADFITARGTTRGGMTTATLIASGMGAWILFSPAEAGAAFGGLAAVVGYAVGSAAAMVAYVFVGPRIRHLIPEGHSITQYAFARYGSGMHAFVLVVSVFYMFIFLAAEMTGISGALGLLAGVPTWQTAVLIGAFVLLYTGYGGLRASIFTDTLQTLVILPLLAIGFAGAIVALGGAREIHATVVATDANLLAPGFWPGIQFGILVVVAILGAELVNQAWWQRIYAADDTATLRRSFAVAGFAALPLIFLAGLFGIAAQGLGLVDETNASISLFVLLIEALPEWIVLVVVLLAVLLVMSTADTLFNAIASLVTSDLPRVMGVTDERRLMRTARIVTVVVALLATFIGAQGYSVLTIFLVADLLAAATFVPLLAGLWLRRLGQAGALSAGLAGLAVGVAYFPTFRPVLASVPGLSGILPAADLFNAFIAAALVSTAVTALASMHSKRPYDLRDLARRIRGFETSEANADVPEPPEVR